MTNHKSKTVGYLLALLLGGLGVHHFYYRNYVRGVLYLLFCWTYVPIFLGWIDLFFIHKWTNRENSQQQASVNNVIKNDKEKDVIQKSTKSNIEQHTEDIDKIINETPKMVSSEKRFYSDNDIILLKYQHLQTPREILTNVEAIINPKKETS